MKKITAMLLSMMMCFSLLALPVRIGFNPNPVESIIIDVDEPENPKDPDDQEQQDPEPPVQINGSMPGDLDDVPTDF